jgi:hypothetical protein
VDSAGNLFVAGLALRKIAPDGTVSTLAGLATAMGSADGTGADVRFNNPKGIALDSAGALYVTSDSTVRKGQLAGPPTITTQPASQSVAPGTSVQFSVAANGVGPLTYQWFFNGAPFVGATTATLTFANARASDAGDYTVAVTNPVGTVTSTKATLTVGAAPAGPGTSTGSGGGGGAFSGWFFMGLAVVGLARRLARRPPRAPIFLQSD